ncbi:uncharacterized protein LOC109285929 [Alligator mississippiensis]|uniref:uncharacterized protein LOC109285929 n=1 Tax=Alligator mississippiensis TaxID=8496 RepID=UPI0028778B98|nr:uncharacterized protein LOC109285929 [Alligator mississippiensis]
MKVIPYRQGEEVEEEQEDEDVMMLEEEALTDIMLHLQGQGKVPPLLLTLLPQQTSARKGGHPRGLSPTFDLGRMGRSLAKTLSFLLYRSGAMQDKKHGERFLLAIPALCRATKQRGEDTLEPETCQVVLLQKIMGLMETVTQDEEPNRILCNSIAAICSLSELKPALEPAMESCLLQTTLKICLMSPRHNSLYVRVSPPPPTQSCAPSPGKCSPRLHGTEPWLSFPSRPNSRSTWRTWRPC